MTVDVGGDVCERNDVERNIEELLIRMSSVINVEKVGDRRSASHIPVCEARCGCACAHPKLQFVSHTLHCHGLVS